MDQEPPLPECSTSTGIFSRYENITSKESNTNSNDNTNKLLIQQKPEEESQGIKFKDWGFNLDRLFDVAYRFYKRNESKAFHPSFDVRNQMNALILQARYGNFDDGKTSDIGTLDLIGKSRRYQWSLLKGISKTEAKSKFICNLDEICSFFKAYVEAVKISSEVQEQTRWKENGQDRGESKTQNQAESDEQLKAIHTSLCRQTYNQFKSYSEKQYPNDPPKQKYLITSLQEQYYQQYISQMHPDLNSTYSYKNNDNHIPSSINSESSESYEPPLVQPQPHESVNQSTIPSQTTSPSQSQYVDVQTEQPLVDTWSCNSSSSAGSPLRQSISYEPLESATIWTKKGVNEFKDSLIDDKQGGGYTIKQGTLLTIQVPTYPDGRYIYWEFVTEDYDIGFGLDFIYEANLVKPLSLKIYEETDEDDDDLDDINDLGLVDEMNYDLESATESDKLNEINRRATLERKRAEKFQRVANTISIVPTYRRDSHEEVFVGRHRYPGQGYYLLKFDNTYSVLRSKSLFLRICYFI